MRRHRDTGILPVIFRQAARWAALTFGAEGGSFQVECALEQRQLLQDDGEAVDVPLLTATRGAGGHTQELRGRPQPTCGGGDSFHFSLFICVHALRVCVCEDQHALRVSVCVCVGATRRSSGAIHNLPAGG